MTKNIAHTNLTDIDRVEIYSMLVGIGPQQAPNLYRELDGLVRHEDGLTAVDAAPALALLDMAALADEMRDEGTKRLDNRARNTARVRSIVAGIGRPNAPKPTDPRMALILDRAADVTDALFTDPAVPMSDLYGTALRSVSSEGVRGNLRNTAIALAGLYHTMTSDRANPGEADIALHALSHIDRELAFADAA